MSESTTRLEAGDADVMVQRAYAADGVPCTLPLPASWDQICPRILMVELTLGKIAPVHLQPLKHVSDSAKSSKTNAVNTASELSIYTLSNILKVTKKNSHSYDLGHIPIHSYDGQLQRLNQMVKLTSLRH